jgi:hypothetical protein
LALFVPANLMLPIGPLKLDGQDGIYEKSCSIFRRPPIQQRPHLSRHIRMSTRLVQHEGKRERSQSIHPARTSLD